MSALKRGTLFTLLFIFISGCAILPDLPSRSSYNITVTNLCSGSDYSVAFYINSIYQGVVTERRTFTGVPQGTHTLSAVGTGYGGGSVSRVVTLNRDVNWVLCPVASVNEDSFEGILPNTLEGELE